MERPMSKGFAACLLVSFALCTTVAQGDPFPPLIDNGDFSIPISADDWVVTAEGVPGESSSGITQKEDLEGRFMEFLMDSDSGGGGTTLTLTQRISLGPGQYRLCFNFTFESQGVGGDESDYFKVLWPGYEDGLEIVTNHGMTLPFVVEEYSSEDFKCLTLDLSDSATFDLGFQLFRDETIDDVTTTVVLDNVQLSVVPVPGAMLLGSVGLAYSAWRLRRQSRLTKIQ